MNESLLPKCKKKINTNFLQIDRGARKWLIAILLYKEDFKKKEIKLNN